MARTETSFVKINMHKTIELLAKLVPQNIEEHSCNKVQNANTPQKINVITMYCYVYFQVCVYVCIFVFFCRNSIGKSNFIYYLTNFMHMLARRKICVSNPSYSESGIFSCITTKSYKSNKCMVI